MANGFACSDPGASGDECQGETNCPLSWIRPCYYGWVGRACRPGA